MGYRPKPPARSNPVELFFGYLRDGFAITWDDLVKPAMLHPSVHASLAFVWGVAGLVEQEPAYALLAGPAVAAAGLTGARRHNQARKHPQLLRTQKMVLSWQAVKASQVAFTGHLHERRTSAQRHDRDKQAEFRWEGQFIVAAGGQMRVDHSLEYPDGITLTRRQEGQFFRTRVLPTGEHVDFQTWGGTSFEVTPKNMDPELLEQFTFHQSPTCYCGIGRNHSWKAHTARPTRKNPAS